MKIIVKNILLLIIGIFISSCSIPKTYEVGMTESQVKFVMGTPLIADTFYPERWDYFTSVTQGSKTYTEQKIILYFEDNKLASWEGELISEN